MFNDIIDSLTPATRYYVRAIARNSGNANWGLSVERPFTTPVAVPGLPRIHNAATGASSISIFWQSPLDNGGADIIRFEVSKDDGETWRNAGLQMSYTFADLEFREYAIRVRAVNSAGSGPEYTRLVSPSPIRTITLDANGGTVNPTSFERRHGSVLVAIPDPTMAGHSFAGWYTDRTWATLVTPTTLVDGDMTLVARWEAFVIVFHCRGHGEPVAPDMPVAQGQRIGPLPDAPRRQGNTLAMRFVGWYRYDFSQDAGTRINANDIFDRDYSIHVFARWESNVVPHRDRILPRWYRSNTVPLRAFEVSSHLDATVWLPAMTQGMDNWTAAFENERLAGGHDTSLVTFVPNTPPSVTSNRVHTSMLFAGDYLGTHWPLNFLGLPGTLFGANDRFSIALHYTNLERAAARWDVDVSVFVTNTMAHELGHAIGLECGTITAPVGGAVDVSIMNPMPGVPRVPTPFDVESVALIYDR